MVALTRFALAASLAGLVAAQSGGLQVTNPSSSSWWVAKSANNLAWTCNNSPHDTFTVLISNSNPAVLTAPIAIISIQNNFDCSKLITQDQSNQPTGTGYRVLLANPLNNTEIYAQSEEFEIKPLGSAYPATSAPAGASATGPGGASPSGSSNSNASQNKPNGAASLKSFGLGIGAAVAAGLAYIM